MTFQQHNGDQVPTTYVATIQLLIEAESSKAAADMLIDILLAKDGIVDWAYLKLNNILLSPSTHYELVSPGGQGSCHCQRVEVVRPDDSR